MTTQFDTANKGVCGMSTLRVLGLAILITGSIGCSAKNTVVAREVTVREQIEATRIPAPPREVPGAVEYVWEAPMVDAIDVPPGLDPEGHYYRPGHQEIVEIRQGRWRYYQPRAK